MFKNLCCQLLLFTDRRMHLLGATSIFKSPLMIYLNNINCYSYFRPDDSGLIVSSEKARQSDKTSVGITTGNFPSLGLS
jgi:hypothetical protein